MDKIEWRQLGELCSFENGDRGKNYPSKADFSSDGIPFLNAGNIESDAIASIGFDCITEEKYRSLRAGKVNRGDILFCLRGTIGKCAISPFERAAIASSLVIIRNSPSVLSRYLYYVLKSTFFQQYLANSDNGSVQGNISVDYLKTMRVPLPGLARQKRIASILGAIDNKIANNKKLMAELEDTARLIYDYWFTQFDFPDKNGRPYRSSGGKMVWSDKLRREIPKEWSAGNLASLGKIISGATPSTSDEANYTDAGIAWITPNDLSDSNGRMHIRHGERDISEQGLQSCSAQLMPIGSVIMSSRAPIGYLAVATQQCCTNQGCKSLIPKNGYGTYFAFFTMRRRMPIIKAQGAGTTFSEVSKETLAAIPLELPPASLASRFENVVQPLCNQVKILELQCDELTSLRDWLLPMLMNGQLVVE